MKRWTRLSPFASRPRARKPAIPRRLQLEWLEDRCVPSAYQQVNLFSDIPGLAQNTDPNLINGWGISVAPGAVWVSSNGADSSVVYTGGANGNPWVNTGLVVSIPGGAPTGQVFNPTSDFVISDGAGHSGKAFFIFASENGTITGWNPFVPPPPPSTQAQLGTSIPDAVFKGIALGSNASGNFLFATDFRHGQIDVFDKNFNLVSLAGTFQDPNLPQHYAPFGIQNINGKLYVTYALQNMERHDDVKGLGHGFIDVYDTNGNLLQRLASRGPLNSPWALALAPSDFGQFSNDLIVGNFGSGLIAAFDPNSGVFQGFLQKANGGLLAVSGLWGLAFGNGTSGGQTNQLLFSAGPHDEADGLFGFIQVAPDSAGSAGVARTAHASSALNQDLGSALIRDGRPGLPAPANPIAGLAPAPVGVSTGGHSTSAVISSEATRATSQTIRAAQSHHQADAFARAVDALFAALRPGDNLFDGR